jgi:RNA polymerase sigma-70 factor (ECF subfamily)
VVIVRAAGDHSQEMNERSDPSAQPAPPAPAASRTELDRRMRNLVIEHNSFVWRSLRRLGVREADCADGCQRVWLVVARKLDSIQSGKIESYLFSVLLRIASDMRRYKARRPDVDFDELRFEVNPDAEGELEKRRARALLDEILSELSWKLRTVFVMFEIEGFSVPEIADALELKGGTVSSRLRLARRAFERGVERQRARLAARAEPASPAGTCAWRDS